MANKNNKKNQKRNRDRLYQSVAEIKRTSKKTKGGNQIGFTALMVVGDQNGKVGIGLGKAKDVRTAIQKGVRLAKKKMVQVPVEGTTIPCPIQYKKKAAQILLKPAPEGSGMIAGGAIREVATAAGIKDMVGKILGTRNKSVNVWATWEALQKIKLILEKHKQRK